MRFKVSVTDRYGMKHIAREIKDAWGAINVLVNNAAVNKADNFATTTDKSWDWVVDTNVNSLFAVTKPFYKQMIRERVGSILNITSVGAIRSLPTSVHYATSKAAMIGFTKCLSREAANFGVTVNAHRRRHLRHRPRHTPCPNAFCKCTISGSRKADSASPRNSPNSPRLWSATATAL